MRGIQDGPAQVCMSLLQGIPDGLNFGMAGDVIFRFTCFPAFSYFPAFLQQQGAYRRISLLPGVYIYSLYQQTGVLDIGKFVKIN